MTFAGKRLSLRGLRTFCVAGRHRSFRIAAEELFVSASAVSHQIKGLEQELQSSLFLRKAQSLEFTDAGASLHAEIDPLIRQIDVATQRLASRLRRRSLRISVQPFFASEMFVPRLPEFTTAHSEIDIHVDTSNEAYEKYAADFDVSIRLFGKAPANLLSDRLFSLRLVPAASPEFCEKWRAVGDRMLQGLPLIVHATRPHAWQEWAEAAGCGPVVPSSVLRLNSMIAVARAAERGLGAALVPVPLADAWFQSGSLVRLFDHEIVVSDGYYFVYRKEDEARDEIRNLRTWILQTFAGA
jgi:LysR family transcriptional regulator, glycine cleavage system transcriptional activator